MHIPQIAHDSGTIILAGVAGSGKTECAIALALAYARLTTVTLVDLDFVNPYFRSQDHQQALTSHGITVIGPDPTVAAIDAPAFPPAARDAIIHPIGFTLVDLGGDAAGAIVMGQLATNMQSYHMWAVLNFSRPTTATVADAARLLKSIAAATRLQLTGLVSNTHIGEFTTAADIVAGLAATRQVGTILQLPVVLLCAPAGLSLPVFDIPVLPIIRWLHRPWEQ